MSMNRRQFLSLSGASITAAFFAGCDSPGPERAQPLLKYAERKNEKVERFLLRHGSMDHARRGAHAAGSAYPAYFVSDSVPVWDHEAHGDWQLE